MALAFNVVMFDFDPTTTGGRDRDLVGTAVFRSRVRTAEAALQSYDIGYTNDDHRISQEKIQIQVGEISGTTVPVTVRFLYRDHKGDDRYEGRISVLVIADLDDAGRPKIAA